MTPPPKREALVICAALIVAILAVYWPVGHQEFVNYDDVDYVIGNPNVQQGFGWHAVAWAFTTHHASNWHPLTWLSHMLDCEMFGLDAGAHKLVNVALHIGSTLLLFLLLTRLTAAPWRSAFVAAVFALHPLRVESVAWVSERKDVLSTFFWMLTMWAYAWYVEKPQTRRYLVLLFCFAAGLMAKSMLVTLPFVLLLLDVWPLRRLRADQPQEARTRVRQLVWEKLPLFMLSLACGVATYWAQSSGGAVSTLQSTPWTFRVANSVVSYLRYIGKTLWPVNLAVFYPYPDAPSLSDAAASIVVIVGVTVLVLRALRRHPFLATGWFWYLGTLVPVVGLIKVGGQSMADRYTYVPTVGLSIILAWGVPELLPKTREAITWLGAAATAVIIALMVGTWRQVQFWQNSITLFEHALAVTSNNYIAHNGLGVALVKQGRFNEAARHFQQAVDVWPEFPEANKSLADMLAQVGQLDEAVRRYRLALQGNPNWPEAENNLGLALARGGQLEDAITHFSQALRLDPQSEMVYVNLGLAYLKSAHPALALTPLYQAVALNPADAQAHYLIGQVLEKQGKMAEAREQLDLAAQLDPRLAARRTSERPPP